MSNPPTVNGSSLDQAVRLANRMRLGLCQTGVFCLRIYLRLSTPLPVFLSALAFLTIPASAFRGAAGGSIANKLVPLASAKCLNTVFSRSLFNSLLLLWQGLILDHVTILGHGYLYVNTFVRFNAK